MVTSFFVSEIKKASYVNITRFVYMASRRGVEPLYSP